MNAIAAAKTNARTASNERLSRLGLLQEPAGYVDGQSLYQYVGGNPANHVDPMGLATDAEIVEEYQKLIRWARRAGYNQAADNLEYFLSAKAGIKTMDWKWLRSNQEVLDAEKTNRDRFEQRTLVKAARALRDGETREVQDYWDRSLEGKGDLYYASGTSTLTSTGKFTLKRKGDTVTVDGVVDHYWWDPYDWHAGLTAWVPGMGNIPDSHGVQLKKAGKAAEFFMESFWSQKMSGSLCVKAGAESSTFTWNDPEAGSAGLAKSKAAEKGFGGGATTQPSGGSSTPGGGSKRRWYWFW